MNLIKHLSSNASVIGPVICGFEKSVQIVKYEADFESIINSVAFMLSEEN